MKTLIFPVCLLLAILGCWYSSSVYSEKTAVLLTESITEISDCSADANWERAEEKMKSFIEDWSDVSAKYALYINEDVLNDAENIIRKCESYIRMKEPALVSGAAAEIKGYLSAVKDYDRLTLSGLF